LTVTSEDVGRLYESHFGVYSALARRIGQDHDDAIDTVHSAFLQVLAAPPDLRNQSRLCAYLYTIVRRQALRSCIAARRTTTNMPELATRSATGPLKDLLRREQIAAIREAPMPRTSRFVLDRLLDHDGEHERRKDHGESCALSRARRILRERGLAGS
jgi:DNA-directed RNA polymerase specialized sigma24 family protein